MKNPLLKTAKIKYGNPDAFCFIRYRGGGTEEVLWNSRDGIVPGIIFSRDGKHQMVLVKEERKRDRYYTPKIGERYIADATKERTLYLVGKIIEARWNHPKYPMSRAYESKKVARYLLFKSFYGEGRAFTILCQGKDVTKYMTKHFRNFIDSDAPS